MPSKIRLPAGIESRDPGFLCPEFRAKVNDLLHLCAMLGIVVELGCTLRGPLVQARMWCRSRSLREVEMTRDVVAASAPVLAGLLRHEFAGIGPRITSRLPMHSWHQLGEAVDVAVMVRGVAIWSGSLIDRVMGIASEIGLCSCANDPHLSRITKCHVQLRRAETPLHVRGLFDSLGDAEREMLERYEL